MAPGVEYPGRSVCTRVSQVLVVGLLLLPWTAQADPFSFLRLNETPDLVSAAAQRDARRSLVLALNNSGNMVLQHASISVTMARKPFEDDQSMQEVLKRLHLQITPGSGGVKIKVAYSF